jgi:hypothetical protein
MTLDLTDDEKLARQAPPARDFQITSDPDWSVIRPTATSLGGTHCRYVSTLQQT